MSIRILRIIARLNIGGPAIHTVLLNAGLKKRGYETLLVTGTTETGEGDMADLASDRGVDLTVIDELSREIRPFRDTLSLVRTIDVIRRFRPHIVHTHTAKAGMLGRLAAFISGVPVRVHTFHGHVFHSYFGPTKTALFLNLERGLARITHRLVAISPLQKEELSSKFNVAPPSSFQVIPLGFEHLEELARARTTMRRSLRDELELDSDHLLVGIVGRLVPVKDHKTFLLAASELLSLVLGGKGL